MTTRKQIKILEERNQELREQLDNYRSMAFEIREFTFDGVPRRREEAKQGIVEVLADTLKHYVTITERNEEDGMIRYKGIIAVARCTKENEDVHL